MENAQNENGAKRRGRYAICKPLKTKNDSIYYKGILNYFGEVFTIIVFKEDSGNVKVSAIKWDK